jgi:serine protease Do
MRILHSRLVPIARRAWATIAAVSFFAGGIAALPARPVLALLAPQVAHAGPGAGEADRRDATVRAVEQALPAVVSITTETPGQQRPAGTPNELLQRFFGQPQPQTQIGVGTGVLIDPDGTILTNEHVIRNAAQIVVTLATGQQVPAMVLGADPRFDLAILKVNVQAKLPAMRLGTASDLMLGERVIAIGNPFGLGHTVTTGIISAVGRTLEDGDKLLPGMIQTDTAINPGNSGGPLVNIRGELVGINTAIHSSAQGIGFAIPVDRAVRAVRELKQFGAVRKVYVGMEVEDLTGDLRGLLNFAQAGGVLVTRVRGGSPAATANLRAGDVIVKLAGQPVKSVAHYEEVLRAGTVGETVGVEVFRGGQVYASTLPLESREKLRPIELVWQALGVETSSLPAEVAQRWSVKGGAVVQKVRKGSPAAEVGLQPGDVILQVAGVNVTSVDDLLQIGAKAANLSRVTMLVVRNEQAFHITLGVA